MVKITGPLASHHASGHISAPKIYSSSLRNRRNRQAPPAPPPPTGGSLLFISTTQKCEAPTYDYWDNQPGTIECWFNPQNTYGHIIGKYPEPFEAGTSLEYSATHLYTANHFNNLSCYQHTPNPCSLNEWTHLAVCWKTNLTTTWVNGEESQHSTPFSDYTRHATNFEIGDYANEGTQRLQAYVTRVRASNIIRYTAPFTPSKDFTTDANTIALWRMTEGAGTTVADESGNGHTLNFPATNLPTWSDLVP